MTSCASGSRTTAHRSLDHCPAFSISDIAESVSSSVDDLCSITSTPRSPSFRSPAPRSLSPSSRPRSATADQDRVAIDEVSTMPVPSAVSSTVGQDQGRSAAFRPRRQPEKRSRRFASPAARGRRRLRRRARVTLAVRTLVGDRHGVEQVSPAVLPPRGCNSPAMIPEPSRRRSRVGVEQRCTASMSRDAPS